MLISWKLESSTTATSVAAMASTTGSNARPRLPPRCTVYPAASNIFAMSVVVVVLPSEPVTATILQGQSRKNSSISLVTSAPASRAATSSGV